MLRQQLAQQGGARTRQSGHPDETWLPLKTMAAPIDPDTWRRVAVLVQRLIHGVDGLASFDADVVRRPGQKSFC
ncbi:hypothetical protein [Paraburkholderia caballeronis]|uniref:hypothetical protein n=1 Tax=Paraburkholderia caballeronis TaxID=416943 RepID=UPI001AD8330F|nr:hypothetical protein [Paraburkholderia caballeronis]